MIGCLTVILPIAIFHNSPAFKGIFALIVLTTPFWFCLIYFGLSLTQGDSRFIHSTNSNWLCQLTIVFYIMMCTISISTLVIQEPIGLLVIGTKPKSGCYRPDFKQKQWVTVPCPSSVKETLPPHNKDYL